MACTRVKICGITRPEDAALAAELGADAIGLNFFAGPRKIDKHNALGILAHLPPLVVPVGLTAEDAKSFPHAPSIHELRVAAPALPISTFQIYGDLPAKIIERQHDVACWAVFVVGDRESIAAMAVQVGIWSLNVPAALILDTAVAGQLGGTGQTFNWHWIAEAREAGELAGLPPIILAGGLKPENVAEAIRIARPYAVDVSSGVEVAGRPGVKDPIKMRDFIQAVRGSS